MGDDPHHLGEAVSGHLPGGLVGLVLGTAVVLVWLGAAAAYLLAGRAAVLRGRTGWPPRRSVAWVAGTVLGLAVTVGPLAQAAGRSFTAHTAVHLALGMLVPLLLVLGAPVSLFLRAVPVSVGRRFSRLAAWVPVRLGTHPAVATLLATVPMALLYRDGGALDLLHHPVLGPLLHVHFVVAGCIFTYAVVGTDPNPHRAPAWQRGAAIVTAIAVHGMVAKHLYAVGGEAGPPDVEQAAQLMYYGGDAVHALLLVVFCAQVYRAGGRRLDRRTASPASCVALPERAGSPAPTEG
ncbi:cytochrome c oxidase assembly protein [Arthrobacter sp. MDT1-48-3]